MMYDKYQPYKPESKPFPMASSTSDIGSVYDIPDIRKSKFFRLKDFQEMDRKFDEELKRVTIYQNNYQEDGDVMEEQQCHQENVIDPISSRLESYDMSRLEEKKKKTGFMFDCFNVFKKEKPHQESKLYESRMITESRYLPNDLSNSHYNHNLFSRYQNKNPPYLNLSNSALHKQNSNSNRQSSRSLEKQPHQKKSLQKRPNPLSGVTQKEMHQMNEVKLDFKLNVRKPQFCMGAFSHIQTNLTGNGMNLNLSLPSLQEHTPFASFLKPNLSGVFGLGNRSSSLTYGMGMQVDESIFNRIRETQSRLLEGIWDNEPQKHQQPTSHNQSIKQTNLSDHQQHDTYALAVMGTQSEMHKSQRQQNISRALQFGLIQMDAQQISFIAHKQQQPEQQYSQRQDILANSIFQNYQSLLKQPQYIYLPVWQSRITASNPPAHITPTSSLPITSFQLSYQWHPHQISLLQSQVTVQTDAIFMLDDQRLFTLVTEMLQGVQNRLFMLDYDKCEWYVDSRGLRFEHVLRGSLAGWLETVLQLANMRSRLEKAVEYMGLRPFRKVYHQVAKQVKDVFRVFEEYLLEFINQQPQLMGCQDLFREQKHKKSQMREQSQKQGFAEFFINIEQLIPEIRLLYQLLICEQQIQRQKWSYFTFDHRFLHSQFYVFQKILKLSRQTDQTTPSTSHLTKRLLCSVFKPIMSCLNRILFQQQTSLSSKQQIYLKYYYESTRELFSHVSKKMEIIHQQSPELYVICKEKLEMAIEVGVDGLRNYERQWAKLFLYKYGKLQAVLDRMLGEERDRRYGVQKQKQVELQALKKRLKDKTQKDIQVKLVERNKRDQELTKLKTQIKQKQQRQRLQDLIQKQAERGYLLQDQLKKKISLLKEKEKLINQLQSSQAANQLSPEQQSNNIKGKSQNIFSIQEFMTEESKPKKWKNHNNQKEQMQQEAIEQHIDERQSPKQQHKSRQQLPIISQQTIMLPIVNEQTNDNGQMILNEDQPKSPKSARSRKIRKQPGKIRSRGKRQAVPGKIYFNKKLNLPNLQLHQNNTDEQPNYSQLCQKSRKLNFHPFQSPVLPNPTQASDTSSSQQSASQSQAEHLMQQQLYQTHAKHHLPCSKQQYIPTNCIFEVCIDKVLTHQMSVVNNCFEILVFQKYHFRDIVKFMKNIFLSQNGENHRTLLGLSVNQRTSGISLKYFNDCFLFDNLPPFLQQLKPSFYNTRQQSLQQIQQRLLHFSTGCAEYYGECNIIHEDLEQYVGFQFANLPTILEPYFSYIHLSKYMQIFSFILRIKHCEMMIGESWLLLNEFKKELFRKQKEHKDQYGGYFEDKFKFETQLLNELFVTRHIIQSFLTTYQNYIFFRVIEKEFKSLNKRVQRNELNELQTGHLKLLDTIIRFAFVDNSVNNITKQIRKLLEYIREFRNIVDLICSDDILEDQKAQVRTKVKFIHTSFKQNQKFFQALYFKA